MSLNSNSFIDIPGTISTKYLLTPQHASEVIRTLDAHNPSLSHEVRGILVKQAKARQDIQRSAEFQLDPFS